MQTLEDVMTPEEFAQARELAQKMLKTSVHALRKAEKADEPQAQKPYMVPVPNTVN